MSDLEQTNVLTSGVDDVRTRLVSDLDRARNVLARLTSEYELAVIDASVIQEDRNDARHMADQARTNMMKATEALARHDAGNYGICHTCGRPISNERLDALPQASSCLMCSK